MTDVSLREAWLRERLEDAYSGALGAHTGSGPGGLPPLVSASHLRSILDTDLSDPDALLVDLCAPVPRLTPDQVHDLIVDVFTTRPWGRADGPWHSDAHGKHDYDRACGVCRGDGQQIGTSFAFAYADVAETLDPTLPHGPSLSRLVSLVAQIIVDHEWAPDVRHGKHNHDPQCAVCAAVAPAIAEAVTAAYASLLGLSSSLLPESTGTHDHAR